jgi:hypothetical protein
MTEEELQKFAAEFVNKIMEDALYETEPQSRGWGCALL